MVYRIRIQHDSTIKGCTFSEKIDTIIPKGGMAMDLVKIGSYIAEKRKKLGMTQKQLAECNQRIPTDGFAEQNGRGAE